MNKSNQQHDDLFKVPDEAIIKSQQVEIGKLNSYIQELEERNEDRRMKTDLYAISVEVRKAKGVNNALKEHNNGLVKNNKKLLDNNSALVNKNKHLEEKIREYKISERFLKEY